MSGEGPIDSARTLEGVKRWVDETQSDRPGLQPSVENPSPPRLKAKACRDMFTAIDERDEYALEDALRSGASPRDTAPGSMGYWAREKTWTALELAVDKSYVKTTKMLLDDKADPDFMPEGAEQTALHQAVADRRPDIVDLLLQHKASPNAVNKGGWTPLELAAENRSVSVTDLLVAQYGIQVNPTHKDGRKTALHRACENGWADIVQRLLAKGALVSSRDERGRLPLHYACESSSAAVVSKLLAAGASPKASDDEDKTPVFKAAENDNVAAIRALVTAGAPLQARDATGRTPLHEASANNRGEAVAQLVSLGAEVNAGAHDGAKPLHDAMPYGAFNAVDQLFEAQAEMTVLPEATDGTDHFRILEPQWDRLLGLPSLGHHLGLGDSGISAPTNGPIQKEVYEEGLQGALWPWNPAPFVLAVPTVHELLYSESSYLRKGTALPGVSWIHLPANNRIWTEDIFKLLYSPDEGATSDADRADGTTSEEVESTLTEDTDDYTASSEEFGKEDETTKRRKLSTTIAFIENELNEYKPNQARIGYSSGRDRNTSKRAKGQMFAVAISVIDIDIRKPYYKEGTGARRLEDDSVAQMKKPGGDEGRDGAPDSVDNELEQQTHAATANQTRPTQDRAALGQTNAPVPDMVQTLSELEAGLGVAEQPSPDGTQGAVSFRQRILTVSKLWIWKLDEKTVVTSFPQRWDQTSGQNDLTRAVWSRLTEMILTAEQRPGTKVDFDSDAILDEIVSTCLEFQPSFAIAGKGYNYPDAFASEIAFVSRQVSHFYNNYEALLGKDVRDFSRSIRLATECLITIEDILSEMAMIRRVFRDQSRVLLSLRTTQVTRDDERSAWNYDTSECGFEGMRSTTDKDVIVRLKHLEKDAVMARTSITTLLKLRQRQVQIQMAISSEKQSETLFRQSNILFIFTLTTVVFAPLAWVSSFMALDINFFTPDKWEQGQVIGAHVGSELVTWVLGALVLIVYLRYQSH